jgi:hypothetical protein
MATDAGDQYASFVLVPYNDNARGVVLEPKNAPYVIDLEDGSGDYGLQIVLTADNSTVSLGDGAPKRATIYLPDTKHAEISEKHCEFKYYPQTGTVVLFDTGSSKKKPNTEPFDSDQNRSIALSRPGRSVVVSKTFNRGITMGAKKYYQFELRWQNDPIDSFLGNHGPNFGPWESKEPRYVMGDKLGAGGFGVVFKAIDLRNGRVMAVKKLHSMEGKKKVYADREVCFQLKMNARDQIQNVSGSLSSCKWRFQVN